MKRLVPLVALAALAGCNGSDATPLDGVYTLERLNGRPLPASESETSGCVFAVSRGALQFEDNGSFNWAQNLQALCAMEGGMPPITSRISGRYSLRGDTLLLRFEPQDSAAPQPPFAIRGLIGGDSIVLEPSATYPLSRTYRKKEVAGE